jgi:DNA (cytosine-5)-methyltransferase 1
MIYGSVCSGIEAATAAWHPLGWKPAFFSEIDAFPRAVLAHHYPGVPLHGDFTTIQAGQYAAIDVLVGGTPCQSFSIAGLRAGLDDDRGNLALEFCRLAQRLRPKWVIWENVPGVLSLDGGRAFASILGGLAECGYGLAYRVLDAQFVRIHGFGRAVPQRRRRVFVVGHIGDWRRAAAVLFERESLLGNPPPRRQAREAVAPTLSACTKGGGGLGTDFDCDGGLVTDVAPCLRAGGNVTGGDRPYGTDVDTCDSLIAVAQGVALRGRDGGATAELTGDVMTSLRTGGGGGDKPHVLLPTSFAIQAGALRENPESGPDGVGVQEGHAYTLEARPEVQAVAFDETQITSATNRCQPKPGDPCHPLAAGARPPTIAFSAKDHGADAMDNCSPTLRAGGFTTSHANAGVMPAVLTGWRVRRLTPRECERLQGFPDDFTAIPYRGKPASDGLRYKALGNSFAVNVVRWIGRRIEVVEGISNG